MSMDNNDLANFWNRPAAPKQPGGGLPAKPPANPAQGGTAPAARPATPANPNAAPVAPQHTTAVRKATTNVNDITLDDLLLALIDSGSSDLHLTHGMPPMRRNKGEIEPIPGYPALSSLQIKTLMFAVMSESKQADFDRYHEMDFAYSIPGKSRFRVNVLQQRGNVGAVIRVIPNDIKTLRELNMPESLEEFASLPRGLVLVTGPTGSGKSTTLAAIIDAANRNRKDHILTIEDPIEFVHKNKNCIVTQREVGTDTKSFPEALKRALRQDPDIILVGEMRDPETIGIAITAAETGHLVFGTLHTQSAAETMSRIIDSFPEGSKEQVRAQLAATIQGIVCQTLIRTLDGRGRVAAMEILKGDPAIRALIRKGQEQQIRSALETSGKRGMQTMDMSLASLARANIISVDEAANRATNAEQFYNMLGEAEVARLRRRQAELGGEKVL